MKLIPTRSLKSLLLAGFCGLLLPLAAETTETNTTDAISINMEHVSPSLVLIKYTAKGEKEHANGVIVMMDEIPYLVLNQHILLSAERISFSTLSGERLIPSRVELSSNMDLARMPLTQDVQGLEYGGSTKMNMSVALLTGGKDKEKLLTSTHIIGIGGTKFEIDEPFSNENNGAPALNEEGRVIGIATQKKEFSKTAMKHETRFDEGPRHFCARLDKAKWQKVNWKKYNHVFGTAYREHKTFGDEVIDVLKNGNIDLREANKLAAASRSHVQKLDLLMRQRGMTGYLHREFEDYAELFEFTEKYFSDFVTSGK